MKIGEMRDRITIQRKEKSVGYMPSKNYTDYITIWAKVEYFAQKEYFSAKATNTLDVVKFIVRYRKDIKNDMRIRFDNDIYDITSIRPLDNKKAYLLLIAEKVEHE